MAHWSGSSLVLINECGLACRYCGYPRAGERAVDLEAVRAEAGALVAAGTRQVTLVSKDPVEHSQFEPVLRLLLELFADVRVETTGLGLHAARGHAWWASEPRILWTLPLVSDDAALHDAIVGRPGHHAVVVELVQDRALRVALQTLLVRDVLAPGNVARTLALAAAHGREVALRLFTPRDTASGARYYVNNVPRLTHAWDRLAAEVPQRALAELLAINPQCQPPCVVPRTLQPLYFEAFSQRVRVGGDAVRDASLADLEACPREGGCAFGEHCLGIHHTYRQAHGDGEFRPDGVDAGACGAFLATPAAARTREVREAVRGARQGAVNPGWSWIATDFDRLPLDGSFALQVLPGGAALRGREEELKAEAARWREAAQALSDALAQGTVGARDAVVLRFLRTAPAEHLEVVRARLDQLNREAELLREGEALKEWRAKADELYRRIDIKTIDRLGHEVDRFVLQAPPAVSESVALHARRLRILHALDRKQWRLALHHFRPGDEARDETWRGLWLRAMVGTLFDHARLNRVQRPAESRRALQKVLQLQPGEPNALRMLDELKDR